MKAVTCVCVLALLCAAAAKTKRADDKVKIAVYYEALCPDSKRFITSQLAPVWRELRGAVKVKLVPYGKSTHDKVNGTWTFTCHHGPEECYGNKVQACLLKDRQLVDTDKMEMVICLMSQQSPDKALDTCAAAAGGAAARVSACAAGERGGALLAAAGDKTDAVLRPLAFVPTVVINEHFNQATQDEAFTNLKKVVCRVAVNKPTAC